MSTFIKCISGCAFNTYGAALYENKDKSASIRFCKNWRSLPNIKFSSIESAESFIESHKGSSGLNTLVNILKHAEIRKARKALKDGNLK